MCLQNGPKCDKGQVVLYLRLDVVLSRLDLFAKWCRGQVVPTWRSSGGEVVGWSKCDKLAWGEGGCGEGWLGETKITTIITIMSEHHHDIGSWPPELSKLIIGLGAETKWMDSDVMSKWCDLGKGKGKVVKTRRHPFSLKGGATWFLMIFHPILRQLLN